MGEVYRARDTQLGRDVAIKVLPRLSSSEPDRLARFEREARMLAALNHPHIGAIYGLEQMTTAVRALVLELVEGETLPIASHGQAVARVCGTRWPRDRRGPEGSLAIARQIAEALEAAHERGIVHRDLKPANIMITPDGAGESARLRPGEAGGRDSSARGMDATQSPDRRRGYARGRHSRHRRLHESRAGRRQGRRQAERPLGVRCRAARDADGAAGICRRDVAERARGGAQRPSRTGRRCPQRRPRRFANCSGGAWRRIASDGSNPRPTPGWKSTTRSQRRPMRRASARVARPTWQKWSIAAACLIVVIVSAAAAVTIVASLQRIQCTSPFPSSAK